MTRNERIERVVVAVMRTAFGELKAGDFVVSGAGADANLVWSWCEQARVTLHGTELAIVAPTNKTALLLGAETRADILPLGDLYYSQVQELAGEAGLPREYAQLAETCGGIPALDAALQGYFDGRLDWETATRKLSVPARSQLRAALDAARFRRQHVGTVPKLGSRTLGIDLYA